MNERRQADNPAAIYFDGRGRRVVDVCADDGIERRGDAGGLWAAGGSGRVRAIFVRPGMFDGRVWVCFVGVCEVWVCGAAIAPWGLARVIQSRLGFPFRDRSYLSKRPAVSESGFPILNETPIRRNDRHRVGYDRRESDGSKF